MGSDPEKNEITPPPKILFAEYFEPRPSRLVLWVFLPAIIFLSEKDWIPFQPAVLLGVCVFIFGCYLEHGENRAKKERRNSN